MVEDATRARMPVNAGMLDLQVQPSIAAGRRRVRFAAVVTNTGPTAVEATLSVGGGEGAIVAAIVPARLLLDPGQTRAVDVVLRPRRPRLAGEELSRTLSIRARGDNTAAPAVRDVVFVQQRLVPAWALALGVVLVAAAVVAVTLLPDRVTVPTVPGAPDVATAERTLKAAGLQLDPRLRSRTSADVAPGTILDQIPDAGSRGARGDRVTLLVAIGSRRAVTPSLSGQTPARAATLLQAAGLTVGPLLPAGAPGARRRRQPAARRGHARARGHRRDAHRPRRDARPRRAAPRLRPPRAAARRCRRSTAQSVNAYLRAVASGGPRAEGRAHDLARAAGDDPRRQPAPGPRARRRRARCACDVAAGVPSLTFDTGKVVRIFDLRNGRSAREAAPPQGNAVEPSWSPDGRRVLYRVGRRLLLVSARLADRGRVVYEGKTRYAAATFAPAPAEDVVALVRRNGGDGDLCFGAIGQSKLRPRCIADPKWDLGRQISWRAGGRELLVFGVRRGKPGTFGMLRYRSAVPFSTNPADWRGALATDTSVTGRGVIAAAYSPAGSSVALVTNVGLPRFQVRVTTPGDLRRPSAPSLPVRACEVAWRPDGGELAVVQSDGACSKPLGQIVRVDPDAPRSTTSVTSGGRHPSYQPLTYAGPKGVS